MREQINDCGSRFANIAPGLLPQSERAKELQVHPETLARARKRGDLGCVLVGGKVYYDREHIVDWLASMERQPRRSAA